MIRIQFTMLDPDPMSLDPKHCSSGPACGLGEELHSRHHDPDSGYHAGSGSNEPGSEALLTWTRMIMESMAWAGAHCSTTATMIRIQLKNAGSGSNEYGSEALLTWTHMMTESMACARSSNSRHHDPDSV
jgi:hypothetical protein